MIYPRRSSTFTSPTTFHEAMHAEALACTRQTHGYPQRASAPPPYRPKIDLMHLFPGDAEILGGTFLIGATPDGPLRFDNEKWGHEVVLRPFRIPPCSWVSNREFREFVEGTGHCRQPKWWSQEGWRWLETGGAPQSSRKFVLKILQ